MFGLSKDKEDIYFKDFSDLDFESGCSIKVPKVSYQVSKEEGEDEVKI